MNGGHHISYWIGRGDDRNAFDRMLEYSISDDDLGDFVASPFCQAVGIVHYDPDFFGGRIYRRPLRLSLLLKGEDAIDEILADWPDPPEANCCVILYGDPYDGRIETFTLNGFAFFFLGAYCAASVS